MVKGINNNYNHINWCIKGDLIYSKLSPKSYFRTALIVTLFLLVFAPTQALAWFDCHWSFRTEVTVTNDTGSAIVDGPVLLSVSASSVEGAYVWSADGDDVRIVAADDQTLVPFYIDSWDAAGKTAEIYLRENLAVAETKTFYFYYGNNQATTLSDRDIYYTQGGIRYESRRSRENPSSLAEARAFFDAATVPVNGYGCAMLNDFNNVRNNSAIPNGSSNNFGLLVETNFLVTAAEEGVWEFRLGTDGGRGAGLYIDGNPLEAFWNSNLWWAYNWNSTSVLNGTVYLDEGDHTLFFMSFEGCCDGGLTINMRRPGGNWELFSTANLTVQSRACEVPELPSVSLSPSSLVNLPGLDLTKSSVVLSDPINAVNPKRIPGAVVRYTLEAKNNGRSADDGLVIDTPIADKTSLLFALDSIGFSQGSPSSGLSMAADATDLANSDLSFSNNNGASFDYAPNVGAEGTDPAVTNVRFHPQGSFECSNSGPPPSFTVDYQVLIE